MATVFKRGGKANRDGVYYAAFTDEAGRRRTICTGTSDKDAARQIAAKLTADVALRKRGVLDPKLERFAAENLKPLSEHVGDYVTACKPLQAPLHVHNKRVALEKLGTDGGFRRLSDLHPDSVAAYLRKLVAGGLSHRTHNAHRCTIVAFANWCVANHRLAANPLKSLKRLDERKDERRRRRAITDAELSRLLAVPEAVRSGRDVYYLCSVLSGLRVGALRRLRWCDIDFDAGAITVPPTAGPSTGKSELAEFPLHPQLAAALLKARPPLALPTCKVFRQIPRVETFHADCQRAGVPRVDADGRKLDRHALRTTFGTRLALCGVHPATAQQLLGHADVKTTMRHYTKLRLSDIAGALAAVPGVEPARQAQAAVATGTDDTRTHPESARSATRSAQAAKSVLRPALTGNHPGTGSTTVVTTGNAAPSNVDGTPGTLRHPSATGGIDIGDRFARLPKVRAFSSAG